jgi:hypothetical protein
MSIRGATTTTTTEKIKLNKEKFACLFLFYYNHVVTELLQFVKNTEVAKTNWQQFCQFILHFISSAFFIVKKLPKKDSQGLKKSLEN